LLLLSNIGSDGPVQGLRDGAFLAGLALLYAAAILALTSAIAYTRASVRQMR
jgi:hypothetical protein